MVPENRSGIYAILHVPSGRRYVGQASYIENRWGYHRCRLRQGRHHCIYLQRAWSKYGERQFRFVVLERCPVERLNAREVVWGRFYRGNLFNIHPVGKATRGYKMSVETCAKMSSAAKRVGADPEERRRRSERAKAQHAAGKLGRKTWKDPNPPKLAAWIGSEENRKALAKGREKALGGSIEMSRRSYHRKLFGNAK
jgi:group I intron endonuclease